MDPGCDGEKDDRDQEDLSRDVTSQDELDQEELALEQELSRYNPALSIPASSRLPVHRSATKGDSDESGSTIEDPASRSVSRATTNPYNKGWRRIVSSTHQFD